jgi:hypothetical protein
MAARCGRVAPQPTASKTATASTMQVRKGITGVSCVKDLGQFLGVVDHAAVAVAWNSVTTSAGVR